MAEILRFIAKHDRKLLARPRLLPRESREELLKRHAEGNFGDGELEMQRQMNYLEALAGQSLGISIYASPVSGGNQQRLGEVLNQRPEDTARQMQSTARRELGILPQNSTAQK